MHYRHLKVPREGNNTCLARTKWRVRRHCTLLIYGWGRTEKKRVMSQNLMDDCMVISSVWKSPINALLQQCRDKNNLRSIKHHFDMFEINLLKNQLKKLSDNCKKGGIIEYNNKLQYAALKWVSLICSVNHCFLILRYNSTRCIDCVKHHSFT